MPGADSGSTGRADLAFRQTSAAVSLGMTFGSGRGREALRAGLDLATRCGATPLGDEAHQALVGAGASRGATAAASPVRTR